MSSLSDNRGGKVLTTSEQVIILHEQFKTISDRITNHKKAQDEGFEKLQDSVDRIEKVLIPRDGSPSIPEQLRSLQSFRKQIIAIWVFIAGIVGKIVIGLFSKVLQ